MSFLKTTRPLSQAEVALCSQVARRDAGSRVGCLAASAISSSLLIALSMWLFGLSGGQPGYLWSIVNVGCGLCVACSVFLTLYLLVSGFRALVDWGKGRLGFQPRQHEVWAFEAQRAWTLDDRFNGIAAILEVDTNLFLLVPGHDLLAATALSNERIDTAEDSMCWAGVAIVDGVDPKRPRVYPVGSPHTTPILTIPVDADGLYLDFDDHTPMDNGLLHDVIEQSMTQLRTREDMPKDLMKLIDASKLALGSESLKP